MRIVLLSAGHPIYDTFPDGGGIQYQILGLATEMARHGHDVHIICHSVKEPSPGLDGITFHPLKGLVKDEIFSVLMFSKRAANVIDSLEADVVSAFERFSAYFPSRQSYPMTFTTENYDAFRYYRGFAVSYHPLNALIHPWKRRLEEGVMRRSDLIFALTESIKTYLASVGIHHTAVIPNGVSSRDYENLGDGRYVLYAGRLDAPKRVDLLIRAFARLKNVHGEYYLRIVGQGPQKKKLMRLAGEVGISSRVRFENWSSRDEMRKLLGRCTVFVLPSLHETFGIALLEAMACGKLVIGSDTPGPKDIIDNGKNGLLFESESVKDLSRALLVCLQDRDLRESVGEEARRTIETSYDFSSVTERTLQAYSSICNGGNR